MSSLAEVEELRQQLAQEIAARRDAEAASLPTTLYEFLDLLRRYSPNPRYIRRWKSFPHEQLKTLELLKQIVPKDLRLFKSAQAMKEFGDELAEISISSEQDLGIYASKAIEEPVKRIFLAMQRKFSNTAASHNVQLGHNFRFDNHLNSLLDDESDRPPFDRACITDDGLDGGHPRIIIGGEYKAPHKFTGEIVIAGLKEMNVGDVINLTHIATAQEANFIQRSERLMATGMTQLYDYLARAGKEFGFFFQGRFTVFARVDWERPETLFYHIAEPVAEAEAKPAKTAPYYTAVCQLLLFCLMGIQRGPVSYSSRQALRTNLPVWEVDEDKILEQIHSPSSNHRSSSPYLEPSDYRASSGSPRITRASVGRCRPDQPTERKEASRTPSPEPTSPLSPPRKRSKTGHLSTVSSRKPSQSTRKQSQSSQQRFCSHKCIQSLVQMGPPDRECPNFKKHFPGHATHTSLRHPFTRHSLRTVVEAQFRDGPNDSCVFMKQGGNSLVFVVTLRAHGYKFVAKGTTDKYKQRLWHEYQAYCLLQPLQGTEIPVLLDFVELKHYCYHLTDEIKYMLFISWAGAATTPGTEEKRIVLQKIRKHGVIHNDPHIRNFCRALSGKLFAIDFEGALIKNSKSKKRGLRDYEQSMPPAKRLMYSYT